MTKYRCIHIFNRFFKEFPGNYNSLTIGHNYNYNNIRLDTYLIRLTVFRNEPAYAEGI